MSETAVPEAAPPAQGEPGFFERQIERVLPRAEAAEGEVAHIAADVKAALQDHASTVFDVSGDLMALLKLVDPADAPLAAAVQALVPKVLTMAGTAASLASAALKGA